MNLAKPTDELRKLILENPDFPIVILIGRDAAYDFSWTYCSDISFHLDEILDCDCVANDDETVFTSRDDLEEYIADSLCNEYFSRSDEEFEAAVKQKMNEYEPYWKKVIAIYAAN